MKKYKTKLKYRTAAKKRYWDKRLSSAYESLTSQFSKTIADKTFKSVLGKKGSMKKWQKGFDTGYKFKNITARKFHILSKGTKESTGIYIKRKKNPETGKWSSFINERRRGDFDKWFDVKKIYTKEQIKEVRDIYGAKQSIAGGWNRLVAFEDIVKQDIYKEKWDKYTHIETDTMGKKWIVYTGTGKKLKEVS